MQSGTNSLKRRLQGAAGWLVAGYGLTQVLRLASSLVLTRLLAPDIYGVMSVGYLVITALWTMSDIGLGPLAIQDKRGEDPRFLNVIWIVQIVRGVVITAGALAAALAFHLASGGVFPAESVYADPRIPTIFAVVALYGLISGFDSTRVYLARRHLALGRLTQIELVSQVVSTVFIIAWAWWSPSVLALAAGWVVAAAVRAVGTHLWLPGPPNRFEWDGAMFRSMISFGKWTIVSSGLSFLLTSGDRLLLGMYLDADRMGLFTIAMILYTAVHAIVNKVIGDAVLPALSEVMRNRPAEARSTLYKIRLPVDIVCAGVAGLLVCLAPWIIRVLYDPRYLPAGEMLSLLGLLLLYTRLSVFDQCVVAQGRMRFLAGLNASRVLVLFTAVPVGHMMAGPQGALLALPCAALVNGAILLAAQQRSGLLSWQRELIALPIFGTGLALGWLAARGLDALWQSRQLGALG